MLHKKYILILISILVIGIFIFSSHSSASNGIGVILPLTGKFASVSESMQKTLELAQEDARESRLEMYIEDSAGDSAKGISALKKLTSDKSLKVILSGIGSTANIAMSKALVDDSVSFFAVSSSQKLMGRDDNIFTLQPKIKKEVLKIVEFIKNNNINNIAVAYDSGSETLTEAVAYLKEEYSGSIATEGYSKDIDYRTLTVKLLDNKPELVYVLAIDSVAGPLVKEIRRMGYAGTIVGFSGAQSVDFLNSVGASGENFIVTSSPFTCSENEYTSRFCSRYKSKLGHEPNYYDAYVYDTYMYLVEVLKACKKQSISSCVQSGTVQHKQTLIQGFSFNEFGDLSDDIQIRLKIVQGGKFVEYK